MATLLGGLLEQLGALPALGAALVAFLGWQWRLDRSHRREHERLMARQGVERDAADHKRLLEQQQLEHRLQLEQERTPRERELLVLAAREQAAAERMTAEVTYMQECGRQGLSLSGRLPPPPYSEGY